MKKALFIATVGRFLGFERSDIKLLQSMGYEVHVAANFNISEIDNFQAEDIITHQVDFARVPLSRTNLIAHNQLKKLFFVYQFDIVHCHTPMGGALGRLAARKYRKKGTRIIYTAHGFHFFKGAPLLNWFLYYPVEWICAHWTDVLITINKEDYIRAQKHMHAKQVEYIPGVGIDLKKFAQEMLSEEERNRLRASLGVEKDDKLLLSVGELTKRKNHESVIRAIAKLKTLHIKYCICGQGELYEYLQKIINDLKLSDTVKLLGFRADISKLCECADLFVFPSFQEGLPVALMEAIASKIPVICSNIRGNKELVEEKALFNCNDIDDIANKIEEYLRNRRLAEIEENYRNLKKHDISIVISNMEDIYLSKRIVPGQSGGGLAHLYEIYNQQQFRKSIGIPIDSFMLFSVGELNTNKNHEVVIRALAKLNNKTIHYAVAGQGELKEYLMNLAMKLGVTKQVHLLGFRNDVVALYQSADLYIHPSLREGLPVALMEAMASEIAVIGSNIRGNFDIVGESNLFDPKNIEDVSGKIYKFLFYGNNEDSMHNKRNLSKFSSDSVQRKMREIYIRVI